MGDLEALLPSQLPRLSRFDSCVCGVDIFFTVLYWFPSGSPVSFEVHSHAFYPDLHLNIVQIVTCDGFPPCPLVPLSALV